MTSITLRSTVLLAVLAVLAACAGSAAGAQAKPRSTRSWVASSVSLVLHSGNLPGVTARTINPDGELDGPALAQFVAVAFPRTAKRAAKIRAGAPVTMGDVDRAFVQAAGLDTTARRAERLIAAAGYAPRPGVGYEIVARLLRLRTNLDQPDDINEHAWYQQASRADAIWSAAQALQWGGWEQDSAVETVDLLAKLPQTTGEQHDAIQRAFDFIGMPYIWGGTSEQPQFLFGYNTAGGFDCSGFVWRVIALDQNAPEYAAKALGGRTTYEMAATTARKNRLKPAQIEPADVLLFGPGGVRAQSGSVDHTGMAISSELFIQSSGQGIALARWDTGYYRDGLAFGKRILR